MITNEYFNNNFYKKLFLLLFGLVKLIFILEKSEEYLPEGLQGILKFCKPCSKNF